MRLYSESAQQFVIDSTRNQVLDLPPYRVSARLSQRPIHRKGMRTSDCLWPDRAMPDLLRSL